MQATGPNEDHCEVQTGKGHGLLGQQMEMLLWSGGQCLAHALGCRGLCEHTWAQPWMPRELQAAHPAWLHSQHVGAMPVLPGQGKWQPPNLTGCSCGQGHSCLPFSPGLLGPLLWFKYGVGVPRVVVSEGAVEPFKGGV